MLLPLGNLGPGVLALCITFSLKRFCGLFEDECRIMTTHTLPTTIFTSSSLPHTGCSAHTSYWPQNDWGPAACSCKRPNYTTEPLLDVLSLWFLYYPTPHKFQGDIELEQKCLSTCVLKFATTLDILAGKVIQEKRACDVSEWLCWDFGLEQTWKELLCTRLLGPLHGKTGLDQPRLAETDEMQCAGIDARPLLLALLLLFGFPETLLYYFNKGCYISPERLSWLDFRRWSVMSPKRNAQTLDRIHKHDALTTLHSL